jgi:carbon-monoxide dehydrogenase small subunit
MTQSSLEPSPNGFIDEPLLPDAEGLQQQPSIAADHAIPGGQTDFPTSKPGKPVLSLPPTRSNNQPARSRRRACRWAPNPILQETSMDVAIRLTVNGKAVDTTVDPRMLLVQFIRERLQLTGTHVGCDTAQCGACTVHLNGRAVKACSMLAVQAQGADIMTIEGLAPEGELHPMQAAFRECHGLQCGFCTPGMVMSAVQLLKDNPQATEQQIRDGLDGNICRCTGYQNIVKSIQFCQSGKQAAPV